MLSSSSLGKEGGEPIVVGGGRTFLNSTVGLRRKEEKRKEEKREEDGYVARRSTLVWLFFSSPIHLQLSCCSLPRCILNPLLPSNYLLEVTSRQGSVSPSQLRPSSLARPSSLPCPPSLPPHLPFISSVIDSHSIHAPTCTAPSKHFRSELQLVHFGEPETKPSSQPKFTSCSPFLLLQADDSS